MGGFVVPEPPIFTTKDVSNFLLHGITADTHRELEAGHVKLRAVKASSAVKSWDIYEHPVIQLC